MTSTVKRKVVRRNIPHQTINKTAVQRIRIVRRMERKANEVILRLLLQGRPDIKEQLDALKHNRDEAFKIRK